MGNARIEIRPVTEARQVRLVDCDGCGTTGEVRFVDASRPDDWLMVANDGMVAGVFCSKACVAKWASEDHPTSAELTDIARTAFRATST